MLQIGFRSHVFVIDMLAVFAHGGEAMSAAAAAAAASVPTAAERATATMSLHVPAAADARTPVATECGADGGNMGLLCRDALAWLFSNTTVLKLGFGLRTDVRRLHAAFPGWALPPVAPTFHVGQLAPLASSLQSVVTQVRRSHVATRHTHACSWCTPFWRMLLVHTVYNATQSFSPLTLLFTWALVPCCHSHQMLGCRLDKSQQCSDWQLRPLSPQQTAYAALDAHSLVQVFDAAAPSDDAVAAGSVSITLPAVTEGESNQAPMSRHL